MQFRSHQELGFGLLSHSCDRVSPIIQERLIPSGPGLLHLTRVKKPDDYRRGKVGLLGHCQSARASGSLQENSRLGGTFKINGLA